MTRQHTPEPWTVSEKTLVRLDCAYLIRPVNETNYEYGATLAATSQQDARRIVACVNACAGVPTEELERHHLAHAGEVRFRIEMTRQRDELLAALEKLSGDVEALMKESGGVYGLHQNGEPAPWGELVVGGRHETWLLSLTDAVELIAKLKAGAA
ncbi:hypothetical protein [Aeromonas veronii]|uniref:hypothetical protein n=1 Tax=Aeromonas veronii TaxID=654 RepID=UPI003DA34FC5